MKNKIKYTATVLLLIVCTAGVMIFPYIYYNSSDTAMEKNVHISNLGITTKSEPLTCKEAYHLLMSPNTTQMTLVNQSVNDKNILQLSENALKNFIANCDKASCLYFIVDFFLERLDSCTLGYNVEIYIGEIDDTSAAVTVATVILDYYGYSDEMSDFSDDATMYLKINYSTAQIYDMSIAGTQNLANVYYDSIVDSLSDEQLNEIDSLNEKQSVAEYFADYWDIPVEQVQIMEYDNNILFSIYRIPYDISHDSFVEEKEFDD